MVHCPWLASPTLEAQAWHLTRAPRPSWMTWYRFLIISAALFSHLPSFLSHIAEWLRTQVFPSERYGLEFRITNFLNMWLSCHLIFLNINFLIWFWRLSSFSKSKILKVGWQAGDPGESCSPSLKAVFWQNSFLLREVSLCSIKAFNWLDTADLIFLCA